MTREELIQVIERKISEQEAELAIDRQTLTILRGRVNLPKSKFKGPIVYGNGHHDGKKKRPGSNPKARIDYTGTTVQARAKIKHMLEQHPEGLTTRQMADAVTKAGIPTTGSTIHNALRALKPIRVNATNSRSKPNTVYALPSNIQ